MELRAGACAARGFPAPISDARWHLRPCPAYMQAPGGEVDVVPAQCHQLRGPETVAVGVQDSRGVPMPRAVLLGGLDEALDLAIGEIFTAALANRYIYEVGAASRSREFSMETVPPVSYSARLRRVDRRDRRAQYRAGSLPCLLRDLPGADLAVLPAVPLSALQCPLWVLAVSKHFAARAETREWRCAAFSGFDYARIAAISG